MISLSGQLMVKIINGRHGAFRVGNLKTSIGEFAIKDKLLDQYDEGSYQGLFDISQIYSSSYAVGSRLVVEVRAVLDNIALANAEGIAPDQFDSLEQDPLDEEQAADETSVEREGITASNKSMTSEDTKKKASKMSEDEKLFGLLWPLPSSFKLDPTVDRVIFRQQRERLKAMGYRFVPVGQYWVKPD